MQDLTAYKENYFIFDSLMLALASIENDVDFVTKTLVPMQNTIFTLINEYPHQDLKISVNFSLSHSLAFKNSYQFTS